MKVDMSHISDSYRLGETQRGCHARSAVQAQRSRGLQQLVELEAAGRGPANCRFLPATRTEPFGIRADRSEARLASGRRSLLAPFDPHHRGRETRDGRDERPRRRTFGIAGGERTFVDGPVNGPGDICYRSKRERLEFSPQCRIDQIGRAVRRAGIEDVYAGDLRGDDLWGFGKEIASRSRPWSRAHCRY